MAEDVAADFFVIFYRAFLRRKEDRLYQFALLWYSCVQPPTPSCYLVQCFTVSRLQAEAGCQIVLADWAARRVLQPPRDAFRMKPMHAR